MASQLSHKLASEAQSMCRVACAHKMHELTIVGHILRDV